MSVNLAFPAGSGDGAVQCVDISISDDVDGLEGEETFAVTLTSPDSVILNGNTAAIVITDTNGSLRMSLLMTAWSHHAFISFQCPLYQYQPR